MAKVAIITRTKDRPGFLARCLESVARQSFSDWVQVVVNDGGDSGAVEEVCERFRGSHGSRLRVLHKPESRGMESATNTGIKESDSRYVVLLDDDDTWEPSFLESCVSRLESLSDPRFRGIACHVRVIEERLEGDHPVIVRVADDLFVDLQALSLPDMLARNRITTNAFLYERSVLETIGYYDETLPVLGDWDFNVRFLSKFDIWVHPVPLANYHVRVDTGPELSEAGRLSRHQNYQALLRNQWLREDMEKEEGARSWYAISSRRFEVLENRLSLMDARLENIDRYIFKTAERIKALPVLRRLIRRGDP